MDDYMNRTNLASDSWATDECRRRIPIKQRNIFIQNSTSLQQGFRRIEVEHLNDSVECEISGQMSEPGKPT